MPYQPDPDQPCPVPELAPFLRADLILDVLRPLKSGKEATVYSCRAHPSTGAAILAAKVYRPFDHRSFRNDCVYWEGRTIPDKRLARAMRNHTPTGKGLQFELWVEREHELLRTFHAAGADVPQPFAQAGPAILMEFVGDEDGPAPLLKHVRLDPGDAARLFRRVLRNVEIFLACDWIHADLSPFNILLWGREIRVIDLPQAVDPFANPNAREFLSRDVENICRHFARFGVEADAAGIADGLWQRFLHRELEVGTRA